MTQGNKQNVSFVIPTFNAARTLKQAVQSIFDDNFQTGDEIVIVNDCSTDGTGAAISAIQNKYECVRVLYNEENKGCPASRNIGVSVAANPLIFNLDADDLLVPAS